MRCATPLLALLVVASPAAAQLPDAKALDHFFEQAVEAWKVPGLAVALVDTQRVFYAKGFGIREVGKSDAVTADTVFPFASCSKTLTVAALAVAAQDGKLTWDDPIRKHLPWFRLQDDYAGANATFRDALCHRVGLGGHDLLWYRSYLTMEEKSKRLARLDFEHPFRTRFEYQAVLFGATGLALEQAVGQSWEGYLQKRLLTPLGMKHTSAMPPKDRSTSAVGHRRSAEGEPISLEPYAFDHPDPAGSVHGSARDFAEFLRLLLRKGDWAGQRLMTAESIAEMHSMQMPIRRQGLAKAMSPEATLMGYGLGWVIQDHHGVTVLQHGGAIDGFRIHLLLIPEANLGAVFCANLDGISMNLALAHALMDAAARRPAKNWIAYYRDLDASNREERVTHLEALKKSEAEPKLPLRDYVGIYEDAAYGTCEIRLEDGKLLVRRGSWRFALHSLGEHRFYSAADPAAGGTAEFRLSPDGKPQVLKLFDQSFRKKSQ